MCRYRVGGVVFPLLLLMSVLLAARTHAGDVFLKYPGNGFPYFSRNIEIVEMRDDLGDYVRGLGTVVQQEGKLLLLDVRNFSFTSKKKLDGSRICMKVDLEITSGACEISIGNLRYIVKSAGVVVEDGGKTVYSSDSAHIRSITIEAFSKGNISTRLHSEEALVGIYRVELKTPASINIEFEDGSSGTLGPWYWLRGYI